MSWVPTATRATPGSEDFGDHLLPRLVERGRTYAHPLDGYWRDLGQPHNYLRAHQDVLTDDVDVLAVPRLADPVPAAAAGAGPGARGRRGRSTACCRRAAASPASSRRSVLGPGVVVEPGAEVLDSVVFADPWVRGGARVHWSVVDTRCEVEEGRPARAIRTPRARGPRRGDPGRPRRAGWRRRTAGEQAGAGVDRLSRRDA